MVRRASRAPHLVGVRAARQRHAHAALDEGLRLAEQAQFAAGNFQRLVHAVEGQRARLHAAIDHRRGARRRHLGRLTGKPRMARACSANSRLVLRDQGHQPGVVRTGRDFREPDLVALHEQFDAENAQPAQRAGDRGGHVARTVPRHRAHRLRLPAFDIVAVLLDMADGFAEMRAVGGAHRQLGDLEVELDFAFHDHARLAHPPGAQAPFPRPARHRRRISAATGPCRTTTSPA